MRYRHLHQDELYFKHFSLSQTWEAINQEITELGSWIIPRVLPDYLKWVIVALVVVLVLFNFKENIKSKAFVLSLILLVVYSSSIITVKTFYKLNQTIDIRVLGSILPFILLIVSISYSNFWKSKQKKITSISLLYLFYFITLEELTRI